MEIYKKALKLNNQGCSIVDTNELNVVNSVIEQFAKQNLNEFERVFENGLNLKGYFFNNRKELEDFVKIHVTCVNLINSEKKTYLVDNIPFLVHNHKIELEPIKFEDRKTTMSASFGSYSYV